jgi:hypothetical protein
MTTQKTPWDLDVRVRERNIRKGVLDDKDVEKYLKELPDSAANAENVMTPQPAVGGGATAAPVAPAQPPPSSSTPTTGS